MFYKNIKLLYFEYLIIIIIINNDYIYISL
jgi:hypothetical protein